MIPTPYLLFLGNKKSAKVAQGLRYWRPENCIGQLRNEGCPLDLGLPDMTIKEAAAAGAKTLVIGVANRGGRMSKSWLPILQEALEADMDIASGLHDLLRNHRTLRKLAKERNRTLFDVRRHDRKYPLGTGKRRTGKRCLAVGTDSSVGKMYTMLAMEREMKSRGLKATFRATGQTGILIAGDGVPLDALIADFMSGGIEYLTPDNDDDHWDLIEGQGSLFHPSYASLTAALLHGAQPDALIVCHEPTRKNVRGIPGFPLPSLEAVCEQSLEVAKLTNPNCKIAGISINCKKMDKDKANKYVKSIEERMGLPAVDPILHGADKLVDSILSFVSPK